jgi:hypothetical protein
VPKNSSDSEIWEEWERLATGFKGSVEELEELMDEELTDKRPWRHKQPKSKDSDVRFRPHED